jgi:hypothetical protein
MNLQVSYEARNFLISWVTVSFSRMTLLHGVSKFISEWVSEWVSYLRSSTWALRLDLYWICLIARALYFSLSADNCPFRFSHSDWNGKRHSNHNLVLSELYQNRITITLAQRNFTIYWMLSKHESTSLGKEHKCSLTVEMLNWSTTSYNFGLHCMSHKCTIHRLMFLPLLSCKGKHGTLYSYYAYCMLM